MVRRIQETIRPDLKIVVMSATLEAEPIAAFLGNCPIVSAEGKLFPVEAFHAEDRRKRPGRRWRIARRSWRRSADSIPVP